MTRIQKMNVRCAFTLVEVMVVSSLTTMLALVLASVWSGLGRPLVEATERAQIAQEAHLAALSLAHDFGGSLATNDARLGSLAEGQLVGRMQPNGTILRLCFDGGPAPDGLADWGDLDTVISYQVQNGSLIRWNENTGATFTVARNVQEMQLVDEGNGVEIKLTLAYRNITHTYTLVGLDP